jgi:ABC-2 type transport system ATP-binding protein
MKQRLGIAATLLGDPNTMILDEPANGLDPEGIRWIRDFLTYYAEQGRTVFVSSHLLSEIALMATDLIVIGRGRLIEQASVSDFVARYATSWVRVRSPQLAALSDALTRAGATVQPIVGEPVDAVEVHGMAIEQVGEAAAAAAATLHELSVQTESLEDAFLRATSEAQEYRSGGRS